jgi:saccharopine dehydrogenase (NAD+, L-lysine-forming)
MRAETRDTERRAPLVPPDAARLVRDGVEVTVEESPQRAFEASEYARAGCRIAPPGSWVEADPDSYVLGLKELPDRPAALRHRHVYFGHAFKGQRGAPELLRRFSAGGGVLLDLEYLADADGRRLTAFGYWAGYVGAALAVLHLDGRLEPPLRPTSRDRLDDSLRRARAAATGAAGPRVLVIGALGRSGRGAREALATAGVATTCWDVAETRDLDRPALLDHDVLVNAVHTTGPVPPFLRLADLDVAGRRLRVVSDVTCDVTSPWNVLPVYDTTTDWVRPVYRVPRSSPPLDVIAIDNLPSLLPVEASVAFSTDLLPHLLTLSAAAPAWQGCETAFRAACRATGADGGATDS